MDNLEKTVGIDWRWVEAHTSTGEKIEKIGEGSTKEAVLRHLKEAMEIAKSKAAPKISFVKKEILNFKPGSFELYGNITLTSKELSSYIKGATHIYAYLVTIGKDVEDAATFHMDSDDHLTGYLLDRIASFAVESMAKNMESALRSALAPEGLSVSMRFSPGYCDWPLEDQFKLAQVIDFSKAGVTLSETCMMIPKKSISAVVGIGPKELFSKLISPCTICNMKVCDYRRNT